MTTQDMIIYFILAQFTSIAGSAIFGKLTDATSTKTSLSLSILIWITVVVWAFFCKSATEYYFVGLLAGLAIGSSQANSRTMLSQLTPLNKQAEFFGFLHPHRQNLIHLWSHPLWLDRTQNRRHQIFHPLTASFLRRGMDFATDSFP